MWLACDAVAASTVVDWLRDHVNKHDGAGFSFDHRGLWKRSWLLNEEDVLLKFKTFCKTNMAKLSVSLATVFVNETLLADVTTQQLRRAKLQFPVSRATVHSWMRRCAIIHKHRHKADCCTDVHERPDVVICRAQHVRNVMKCELRQHTWLQVTQSESEEHRKKHPEMSEGHKCIDGDGVNMVEHHVDDCEDFTRPRSKIQHGGCLSVRMPERAAPLDHL
eukprot:jgi/Bigna1/142185/aug1.68_g16893